MTVMGAILIITAWIALLEFDNQPESERTKTIQTIKHNPLYIVIIALLPLGIIINIIGTFFGSLALAIIGASLIILQSLIVSYILWKRTRWKAVLLLVIVLVLGIFVYTPLIIV